MEHFEDVLRRYRPSGPPAGFRKRVLGGEPAGGPEETRNRQGQRWSDWVYPIAAAAAAMTFYALTDSTHRHLISASSTADAERDAAVADMTEDLGGDDAARLEAERLIRALDSAGRTDAENQVTVAIEETTP